MKYYYPIIFYFIIVNYREVIKLYKKVVILRQIFEQKGVFLANF